MWNLLQKFYQKRKITVIVLSTFVLTLLMYGIQQSGDLFRASIMSLQEAQIEFDGTTYPIQKIPNWITWNGDNQTTLYSEVASADLVEIPTYNTDQLATSVADLQWGNSADNVVRLAKITYSVVYLGNYTLDGIENVGSHPAVDIRVPQGTPVYAMANGIVTEVYRKTTGFGYYIVIKHPRVPDLTNSNTTTTIYSSYSHLSQIDVEAGDVVERGDKIGLTGKSGTATTPHLHFQIDEETAPWHPYWPFTSAEAANAGWSFFEAINNGLNQDKAAKYTIHPVEYVETYLNYSTSSSSDEDDEETQNDDEENDEDLENNDDDDSSVEDSDDDDENDDDSSLDDENDDDSSSDDSDLEDDEEEDVIHDTYILELSAESFVRIGGTLQITVIAEDENGFVIENFNPAEPIEITHSGEGTLSRSTLTSDNFYNGRAIIDYSSEEVEEVTVSVGDQEHSFQVIDQPKPATAFKIETDEDFIIGIPEPVTIWLLDEDGNLTSNYDFSNSVTVEALTGEVEFSQSKFLQGAWGNGKIDFTFTAQEGTEKVKLKVSNKLLFAESSKLLVSKGEVFTDVNKSHTNFAAIKYLKENDIINGYPDGSFRPGATVNRAEALKILLLGLDIELVEEIDLDFPDTEANAWYAPYVATAADKNIVDGYPDGTFQPAKNVNKAEFMKILLETKGVEVPQTLTKDPYQDVDKSEWFAGYASYVKTTNLLEVVDNMLNASADMTRGDVAEMMYRLIVIQLAQADAFSVDLTF